MTCRFSLLHQELSSKLTISGSLNKAMSKPRGKMNLQEALRAIEKKHGEGSVMRIAKGKSVKKGEVYKTGVYSIDRVLGGGFAKGRIVEIFGTEGAGKTTLALQTIIEAQKNKQK